MLRFSTLRHVHFSANFFTKFFLGGEEVDGVIKEHTTVPPEVARHYDDFNGGQVPEGTRLTTLQPIIPNNDNPPIVGYLVAAQDGGFVAYIEKTNQEAKGVGRALMNEYTRDTDPNTVVGMHALSANDFWENLGITIDKNQYGEGTVGNIRQTFDQNA